MSGLCLWCVGDDGCCGWSVWDSAECIPHRLCCRVRTSDGGIVYGVLVVWCVPSCAGWYLL